MNLITRAVLFLYRPFFIAFLGLNTAVCATTIMILAFVDPTGNLVHFIGKFWSRMNLFLAFTRVRVKGVEHIEKGRSYILMSNHQSHYDVWALIGYVPLQIRWVMKKELRKVPLFGYACHRMGHIYVDRSNSQKSHEELRAVSDRFKSGASVVFFPEGTRSDDGALLPFKKGGFVMALTYDVPILPVTVNGSRRALQKNSLRFMPGRIDIVFHPPVAMAGYTMEHKEVLMEKVRSVIASALE